MIVGLEVKGAEREGGRAVVRLLRGADLEIAAEVLRRLDFEDA